MKNLLLILLLCFTVSEISAFDQDSIRSHVQSIGFSGAVSYNIHKQEDFVYPDFQSFISRTEKPAFGAYLTGLYEYPISNYLRICGRIGISSLNGASTEIWRDHIIGNDSITEFTYDKQTKNFISEFIINPFIKFYPYKGLNLTLGISYGFIFQGKYESRDIINDTGKGIIFPETGGYIRNEKNGNISNLAAAYTNLHFGIGYEVFLDKNNKLSLTPEIAFHYGLNNLTGNYSWNINSIKSGISLKYFIITQPAGYQTELKNIQDFDTTYIERDDIIFDRYLKGKSIYKSFSDTLGRIIIFTNMESRTDTLYVAVDKKLPEITLQTRSLNLNIQKVVAAFPLLPVIFFEKSDTNLNHYNCLDNFKDFDLTKINHDPISINKNVLNIIGQRLNEEKDATIILKGFADKSSESADCALANKRAESIKEYLVHIWKIDESRISISLEKIDCAPLNETKSNSEEAFAENRRVEIITLSHNLFNSIKLNLDEIKGFETGILEFRDNLKKEFIKVNLTYDSDSVFVLKNNIRLKNFSPVKNINLYINLKFDIYNESKFISSDSIRLGHNVLKTIERHSLILFDIASGEIPIEAKKQIQKILYDLKPNQSIRIKGFTDILGSRIENLELSQRRAENTAKLIKEINPSVKIESIEGLGSEIYPPGIISYDSALERFLSRLVQLEITE